jgi:pyruvate kinase
MDKEIGILQDLAGPKIRLGTLFPPERELETGEQVTLISAESSDSSVIPVNYPYLLEDVAVGDRILLADGTVELTVKVKQHTQVDCEVTVGGTVQSHKGINLPASDLRIAAFTEKDRLDLKLGLEEKVDFIGLSFVRTPEDIDPVLEVLDQIERRPLIIAKIEKPQAVERLEAILAKVDGVMVARGDLGVEVPLEDVPIIQKRIIEVARKAGKPVITATQMLRSMMENPRPTRAEAADIANAILDGTDALMLSDETAIGSYPRETVMILDRVARATEPYLTDTALMDQSIPELLPQTAAAIGRAAYRLALDLEAAVIVATTFSGSTARLVARFRPPCPVAGLTSSLETQRQLALSWGVIPIKIDLFEDTDRMFDKAKSWALRHGLARSGDLLIITAGVPLGVPGTTNLVKVVELED